MLTKNKVLLYIFVLTVLSLFSFSSNAFSMGDARSESPGSSLITDGHGHGFIIAGGFYSPSFYSWLDRKPRGHHHGRHEWHEREHHERHEGGHHERHEHHHEREHHERHEHHGRH